MLMNAMASNVQPANKFRYQGKLMQDELGMLLYDFHARQYDPQIGRFWGVDPADQFPSGYTGMGNDPANEIDPTGMIAQPMSHDNIAGQGGANWEDYYEGPETGWKEKNEGSGGGSGSGGDGPRSESGGIQAQTADQHGQQGDGEDGNRQSIVQQVVNWAKGFLGIGVGANADMESQAEYADNRKRLSNLHEQIEEGKESIESGLSYVPGATFLWNGTQLILGGDPSGKKSNAQLITGGAVDLALAALPMGVGKGAAKGGSAFFEGAKYSDKVIRQMGKADDIYHAFPKSVDGYATKFGQWSTKLGADGKPYQWLKMPGSYGGKTGVFEYTKDANGLINHSFFNVPKAP